MWWPKLLARGAEAVLLNCRTFLCWCDLHAQGSAYQEAPVASISLWLRFIITYCVPATVTALMGINTYNPHISELGAIIIPILKSRISM